MLKKDAKYCHQFSNPIYPFDNVVIRGSELGDEEEKEGSVKYPLEVKKIQKEPEVEPEHDSTKKKAVIKMFEDIDPNEDITPVEEERDFQIHIVDQADCESSEEEGEAESDESKNQLEAQNMENSKEEDKQKSNASVSTPTKVEDSKSPMKPMEIIKCSQNSLSNFFDNYESSSKTPERPLKEKKDLLVGLLNDDLSNIKLTTAAEKAKKPVQNENENLDNISSFMTIKNNLTAIAKKYGKSFEEVMKLFEQASCRYDVLEDALQGKVEAKNKMWNGLEDLVLNKPYMNEEAFNVLISEKGEGEIENRKKFLHLK